MGDGRTAVQRFREWLYRKHSLTIDALVFLMILTGLGLAFLWWMFGQWT